MNDVIPQTVALRLQLAAIAGNEPAGGLIEVRWRLRDGRGMGQGFHAVERPGALVESIQSIGARTDVYLGATPRRARHGGAGAVHRSWQLWIDLDVPDAIARLEDFRPAASIVLLTGTPGHALALWPLRTPVAPAHLVRANRRLAHALGGDLRATDAARIVRAAGTKNFKREAAAPVECVRLELAVFEARDIVGALPDPPASTARKAPIATRELPSDDALKTIPASVYVPALAGVQPGRDGKIACPFHDDATPSLHVYDDHWRCYGCDRGGTIIDFGAALYEVEPRGRGYFDIRRRLATDLLGRLSA